MRSAVPKEAVRQNLSGPPTHTRTNRRPHEAGHPALVRTEAVDRGALSRVQVEPLQGVERRCLGAAAERGMSASTLVSKRARSPRWPTLLDRLPVRVVVPRAD